ncbi:sodium/potassium-transporting ATPase subunit beta-2-like [Frankliniella occidentalis]|uniref:Sodium/potassium-transporting ATPase subunit beta-2-like n=1 Tax=Frankliniella occidentalis TaxID=133901 RepID=A0A9C6WWV7_FRAOC|nr:sodium/potassium-transporting ATPase subunit beta-2-like [Frankliniella occidentalis]
MGEKTTSEFYLPPPKVGKWESFSTFLWNSETSQFMGRTGSSWAKILLFYLIFYACLCGFFAALLTVFYQTLDMHVPKWQQDASLIGNNPGLGFRPLPPGDNVESTLIWYRTQDAKNYESWTAELDKFLEPYQEKANIDATGENVVKCDYDLPPGPGKVCRVEMDRMGPCMKEKKYNYPAGGPCIFLKLNKIYGWIPQYYNTSGDLPKGFPEDIKSLIKKNERKDPNMPATKPVLELNTVWISCEGENPADVENIGPINYYPRRGFPSYFFPYKNDKGYLSPLVGINFERPATGVLINIECKAWARNIHHDRADRRGSVHFEIMIDN